MTSFRSLFLASLVSLLALPVVAAPTVWTIDGAHSSASFTVKHLSLSTVHGELGTISGSVSFDAADLAKSSIEATIDVKSISTHNEKRDAHLNSPDFFDTAKFPTATFKSTSITKSGEGKLTIVGNLTLHGVTKAVTLEAEGPAAEQKHPMIPNTLVTAFSAKGKINRKDFGVSYGPNAVLSDEIPVELDLEANRKG